MAAIDVGTRARIGKRRGNEELLGHEVGAPSTATCEQLLFSCECQDVNCTATVWMTKHDFWTVSRADGYALVAPGHAADDERVIASTVGYLLVAAPA